MVRKWVISIIGRLAYLGGPLHGRAVLRRRLDDFGIEKGWRWRAERGQRRCSGRGCIASFTNVRWAKTRASVATRSVGHPCGLRVGDTGTRQIFLWDELWIFDFDLVAFIDGATAVDGIQRG